MYGIQQIGRPRHPALVGGYDLLGEFADYSLFDDEKGTFEVDTESWAGEGSNTIEVSTDIAHGGAQSIKNTYVNNSLGMKLFFRDADDLISDLTIGKKYRMDCWAAMNAGRSATITVYDGSSVLATGTVDTTSMVRFHQDFICASAAGCFIRTAAMNAGDVMYLDDITLQELYTPDYSGRANPGTVIDAVATPWGYSFNGSSAYVDLGSVAAFGSQDFTIIARINAEANGANNNTIFSVGDFEIDFHVDTTGPLELFCADTTPTKITGTTNLEDVSIHDVAVSKRGPNVSLYIDERLEAYGSMAGIITFGNTQSYIGYDTASYFKGTMGRLLFIPQALTQREIWEEIRQRRPGLRIF